MGHHITGHLLAAQLHAQGAGQSLHLWLRQPGQYGARPVRAVRFYPAAESARATRHLGHLHGHLGTLVHAHGQALLALAGGVCLVGLHRIAFSPAPATGQPDAAANAQPPQQAWPLCTHRARPGLAQPWAAAGRAGA
jgi:hypothetical protein